jgi:hypothetical protein
MLKPGHPVPSLVDVQTQRRSHERRSLLPAHVLVVVGVVDERWLLAEAYRTGYHHDIGIVEFPSA